MTFADQSAAVVGQLRAKGKGQETAATTQILGSLLLAGRVATPDALLTQQGIR